MGIRVINHFRDVGGIRRNLNDKFVKIVEDRTIDNYANKMILCDRDLFRHNEPSKKEVKLDDE